MPSSNSRYGRVFADDSPAPAAVDQLDIWAKRLKTEIVLGASGGDPSAVLFDAMAKAKSKNYDVVLCDTAGRLESNDNTVPPPPGSTCP